MTAAHHTTSPTRSIVLRLLSLPIFFVLPTTMPPLPGFTRLQTVGQFISGSKQNRTLQILLVVSAIVTSAWIVIAYASQRRTRIARTNVDVPEKSISSPLLKRQDSAVCQNQWEIEHKNYLKSLKQEIFEHTEKPVFPWVSPPQALPGPYDPMYYPLPAPSPRCGFSTPLAANAEGRHSSSYTRTLHSPGTLLGEAVLYGTMTTSTNGWRRSHWNVSGG